MSGNKVEPLLGFVGKKCGKGLVRIVTAIAIYEGLGDNEATGEGDVELAGVRFALELYRRLLELAVTESICAVHEDGCHAINKITW
jgi:hypothetical protein